VAAGELMGVLGVTRQEPPRYRPEEVSAAQALASQVAVALGNVALFQRAQALASAETRQAIARDLRDSVSQTLFSVTLQVRAAQAELRKASIGEDHPATCWSGGSTSKDTTSVAYSRLSRSRSLARIPSTILSTCCLILASSSSRCVGIDTHPFRPVWNLGFYP
jgi:hypothetical protein